MGTSLRLAVKNKERLQHEYRNNKRQLGLEVVIHDGCKQEMELAFKLERGCESALLEQRHT